MVPVFFRLELKFKEQWFNVYGGQLDILSILLKNSVFLGFTVENQ